MLQRVLLQVVYELPVQWMRCTRLACYNLACVEGPSTVGKRGPPSAGLALAPKRSASAQLLRSLSPQQPRC